MSGIGKLNLADFIKGLIVAVITAGLTAVQQVISTSGPNAVYSFNWKLIGGVALAAAVGYILKNLLSDNTGAVLGIEATKGPQGPTPKG